MDDTALAALEEFHALILRWAPKLDLVSEDDLPRVRERHIDDSLRLAPLVATLAPGPCIDVGSGAGFPGIPLAIAHPDRHWRLLEPRRKRAGFLDEVARDLGLDVEVLRRTAAEAALDSGLAAAHVLATARALAPPPEAFGMLAPLVAGGGIEAVFVGRDPALPEGTSLWAEGLAIRSH